jgi:hypothetical protein
MTASEKDTGKLKTTPNSRLLHTNGAMRQRANTFVKHIADLPT